MKQKKGEIYKMRNHFSSHRKNKHRKIFLRSTTQKETEKSKFFDGREKRERFFFLQKPEKITFVAQRV